MSDVPTGRGGMQRSAMRLDASVLPATLPGVIDLLSRHRVLVIVSTLACAAVMAAVPLLKPRTYTAGTSFILSSSKQGRARLGGMAAEFGISLGGGTDAASSPEFYADLLTSRAILEQVVRAPITVDGRTTTLVELEGHGSPRDVQATRAAASQLRKRITVRMETQTGLVSVAVAQRSPSVAEQVASSLLATLNRFNLEVRKSQASMERGFVTRQLESARADLLRAEGALEAFMAGNRAFVNSPDLTLRRGRLDRELALRQRIVEQLSESLEQARIDEVRQAPVITVIDHPAGETRPDPRGVVARALIGLILGFMLGVFLSVARDYRRAWREQPA